ncbi:MAG: hypothetical protein J0I06_03000 [Planctomycetes bacterium]|nr:hypothetical protein [Planctomycetota bacterium]
MRVAVWILVAGAVAGPAALVRPAASAAPGAESPLYGTELPADGYVSSTSCAAAACHGRGHAGGMRSEYLAWSPDLRPGKPNDPHARAYQVLFNSVSKRIASLMELPKPAHETSLCLKCHAVEAVQPAEALSEGVGCCGCHGPAKKWLTVHYQPAWKALSHREKWEQYGFLPVQNLTTRAVNCAGCHVGDATREVNHELIAAGHPRLTFEFAGLHVTPGYRKHWEEPLAPAEFESRAWVIGQATSLRNATKLLGERAKRAESDSEADWPEFAGYSCVSCHRAIRKDTPRPVPRAQQTRGKSGWEMLSVAAVDVAAEFTPRVFVGAAVPRLVALGELREVMAKGSPNLQLVRQKSAAAVAELDDWLTALQAAEDRPRAHALAPEVSQQLLNALAASALTPDRGALRDHDPDFLAAHAAGCRAVLRGSPDVRLSGHMRELVEVLPVPHTPNGRLTDWGSGLTNARMLRVRDQFRDIFDRTRPGGKR